MKAHPKEKRFSGSLVKIVSTHLFSLELMMPKSFRDTFWQSSTIHSMAIAGETTVAGWEAQTNVIGIELDVILLQGL